MTLLLDTKPLDRCHPRPQPGGHLAEPVRFAVLRAARPEEARLLEAQFATLPLLPTPAD